MPRGGISPGPSSGLALGGGLCFLDDAVPPTRGPARPSRPPWARSAPASARRCQNGPRLGGMFDMRARSPSRMPPNIVKSAAIWREERPSLRLHIKRATQSHGVSGEKDLAPGAGGQTPNRPRFVAAPALWQRRRRAAPASGVPGLRQRRRRAARTSRQAFGCHAEKIYHVET